MATGTQDTQVIRFATFEVNLRDAEVRKGGVRLRVPGQSFQVLKMLLECPGGLVTREEFQRALWPSDTFVDFDHGLSAAVNRLREALGDSADNPQFIETLPRRGYRFIGAITPSETEQCPQPIGTTVALGVATTATADLTPVVTVGWKWSRVAVLSLGATACILLATVAVLRLRDRLFIHAAKPRIQSLAVLPLESLSRDPEEEHFADAMTDALITDLGKVSALRVISRTSVMRFKDAHKPVEEIARQLGVDALVEGAVTRSGGRVRITANLIRTSPEMHLWSESYERDLREVLALQSDVAQAIAHEVQAKLTPSEHARLAGRRIVNADAYELYLKGQYFQRKGTEEGRKTAIRYFEQSIEIDPNNASAYVGIAQGYAPLGYYGAISPVESDSKAVWAATKAIELDDTLSEAHAWLGIARAVHEWDWPSGERELQRAIELNPGEADGHAFYAQILMMTGRPEESEVESNEARKLDPLDTTVYALWGERLVWSREYDRAIEKCQEAIELDPTYPQAQLRLGVAYEAKGEYEKAITALESARDLSGRAPYFLRSLGHAYAAAGRKGQAQQVLQELRQDSAKRYVSPFAFALIYTGLGEKEQAFDWLEKAYQQRDPSLSTIRGDPRLDPLRGDPRFQDILRRIHLGS